jgi:hypothetical protein
MAQNKNARAEAKGSATGAAAASGSTGGGRRPKAVEGEGGQPGAEAATETAPQPIPLLVIATNPKRKGTIAYGFFEKYGPRLKMTDLHTARYGTNGKDGVRGKDVSWDRDRRHILLKDEATNFPINGTREEQANYLRSLPASPTGVKIEDKQLIAWGFMDAPPKETAAAEAEVAKADAAAS